MEINRGRDGVFLHLRLFLTSYPLLQETMQCFSNLSFPLIPRQTMSLCAWMKMILCLHIVSPFIDGLISLVATLSGGMRADGFSFEHDFLPPTHIHEFYFMIDYMCVYTHDYYVLNLSLLYYMIKHGRDTLMRWSNGCTGCMSSPNIIWHMIIRAPRPQESR